MTTAALHRRENARTELVPRFVYPPAPLVLRMGSLPEFTDDQLYEFCRENRDWRIERKSDGGLLIMAPTGGETGKRNSELNFALFTWAKRDRSGVVFDSSTGFVLANGAMRSPDAAWIRRSRLDELTAEEKKKFLPLAPDFVVELRSPSDSRSAVEEKMAEWIDNGTRLGYLLDPAERSVTVYRPGCEPEVLEDPATVASDDVLPGFVLELQDIWEAL